MSADRAGKIGVAIATRDRRARLLGTLERLVAAPEPPPIVVADNGSRDDTLAALAARFPPARADEHGVRVLALRHNLGAAARTAAARELATPYVAFTDDDSGWDGGALTRAARLLDAHPQVGLIAARVVVGDERRLDPTCDAMASSPLAAAPELADGPGVPVVGFVACGAVARCTAFLGVGGFPERYGIGGEEQLLALDLWAAGWQVRYVPEVIARHWPAADGGDRAARASRIVRNDLWSTWLRRPPRRVPAAMARTVRDAGARPSTARGAAAALGGLPWVLRERRRLPASVERSVRAVERADWRGR